MSYIHIFIIIHICVHLHSMCKFCTHWGKLKIWWQFSFSNPSTRLVMSLQWTLSLTSWGCRIGCRWLCCKLIQQRCLKCKRNCSEQGFQWFVCFVTIPYVLDVSVCQRATSMGTPVKHTFSHRLSPSPNRFAVRVDQPSWVKRFSEVRVAPSGQTLRRGRRTLRSRKVRLTFENGVCNILSRSTHYTVHQESKATNGHYSH